MNEFLLIKIFFLLLFLDGSSSIHTPLFQSLTKLKGKIQCTKIEWKIDLHACQLSQNSNQNPTANFFRRVSNETFSKGFFSLCMGPQFLSNAKHTKFELFETSTFIPLFQALFFELVVTFSSPLFECLFFRSLHGLFLIKHCLSKSFRAYLILRIVSPFPGPSLTVFAFLLPILIVFNKNYNTHIRHCSKNSEFIISVIQILQATPSFKVSAF